jgi:hypothetical protein
MAQKFFFFITQSPTVRFYIELGDLDNESFKKLEQRIENCKTAEDSYNKLNYIFTEVIFRIAKQTEPLILSRGKGGDHTIDKMQFNRIREWVSGKWELVDNRGVEVR